MRTHAVQLELHGPFVRRATRRAGISLLEVLISMFVLTIGLLSVSALIPAARFQIVEGAKVDRAVAMGRQAFHTLEARGFLALAPRYNGSTQIQGTGWAQKPNTSSSYGAVTTGSAVCLDPLWAAQSFATSLNGVNHTLPYDTTGNGLTSTPPTTIPRITIGPDISGTFTSTQRNLLVDDWMRAGDDLVFALPSGFRDDGTTPFPQQSYLSGSSPASFMKRQSVGDFSWMATIVQLASGSDEFTVSIAVFFKRDLSGPDTSEIVSPPLGTNGGITFLSAGIGGGDVTLPTNPQQVRPGQWVLLSGTNTTTAVSKLVWYRVVATDTYSSSASTRQITLLGPDWDATATAGIPNPRAWIFPQVIAVYEKQMHLEQSSPWSN